MGFKMTTQIYADEISNLYVANGLVRLELSTYCLENDGQITKNSAGRVILHLNGFIGLQTQMEQVIQKMIADGMLVTNAEPTPGAPTNQISSKSKPKVTSSKSPKKV
jgi:hypothetical protein